MKYYIGIDAGGTKSKCILADENLNIISENINGSGAFLIHGIDTVAENFHNCIMECLFKVKVSHKDVAAVVIGCAGAGGDNNANKFRAGFIKFSLSQGINYPKVVVTSDAIIALEGAFTGKAGAILIAGTGSILLGKDEHNKIHRVGGAGRIVGDEGSGFKIGANAANAVYKYYDGRGQETLLTDYLNAEFDINNIDTLIYRIYSEKLCPSKITPFVVKAAEEGDEVAINILEEQALELTKHVQVMRNKIEKTLKVVFIGGLLSNSYYAGLVKKLINVLAPGTEIILPEFPPEIGAVIMAKNLK